MANASKQDLAAAADEATAFLKTVANPTRLMVLCLLGDGERTVGDLLSHVPISATALSQHLARMREDGLVDYRRDHRTLYYSIADKDCHKLIKMLAQKFCS